MSTAAVEDAHSAVRLSAAACDTGGPRAGTSWAGGRGGAAAGGDTGTTAGGGAAGGLSGLVEAAACGDAAAGALTSGTGMPSVLATVSTWVGGSAMGMVVAANSCCKRLFSDSLPRIGSVKDGSDGDAGADATAEGHCRGGGGSGGDGAAGGEVALGDDGDAIL